MNDLFNSLILQEATPRLAKQMGIKPDEPPDATQPQTQDNQNQDQLPSPEENAQQDNMPEEDPPEGEAPQQQDAGNEEPPADQGGGEEAPPEGEEGMEGGEGSEEGGDPGAEGGEEGLEGPTGPEQAEDPLDQAESEVFSNLKPEQFAIRIKTLKQQYKNLHDTILDTLDQMNKLTKTSYDANMIEFATRRLLELKDQVRDALVDAFPTRTYVENEIEIQKATAAFNQIYNIINTVYDARLKRAAKYDKENKSLLNRQKNFDLTSETEM